MQIATLPPFLLLLCAVRPFCCDISADAIAQGESILPLGGEGLARKKPEDAIPVIEVRGEGKPMSAAQIRELEEMSNGGPLDIKLGKTWVPGDCPRKARRMDFVTFHYKGFTETKKKFDQTYGREKEGVNIQLGVGMVMPGLDKGLKGMCNGELRTIEVPYRLSRKAKSKVWKNIPNEEHWLRFDVEMVHVEPWSVEGQFRFMDLNNDSRLTEQEMARFGEKMRREFGKRWPNEDIDTVLAARYYVKYFDVNGDGKVQLDEFRRVFQRDMALMETSKGAKRAEKWRKRDPGFGWILDFNNDGVVSQREVDEADQVLQGEPKIAPKFGGKEEL